MNAKDRHLPLVGDHYAPPTESTSFRTIHQGKGTNALAKIRSRIDNLAQINMNGEGVIAEGDFKLFITQYNTLSNGVRPTAKLLLDALVIVATESGQRDTLVEMPLAQYMELRGLVDVKEARAQVKADLDALSKLRIEFREATKSGVGDYLNINLYGGTSGIRRGAILFRFNQDFFSMFKAYPVMPYPKELFRINTHKNPHSYFLYRKISEHKNMNIQKSNENIIGVKTLIDACPELPKYENIKATGNITNRIIDPFERDMDALENVRWEYCGKNGSKADSPKTYAEFVQLNILVFWEDYPPRSTGTPEKRKRKKGPVLRDIDSLEPK